MSPRNKDLDKLKHALSHMKFSYTDSLTDREQKSAKEDPDEENKHQVDYYQKLMKKLDTLKTLNSYTIRDMMK